MNSTNLYNKQKNYIDISLGIRLVSITQTHHSCRKAASPSSFAKFENEKLAMLHKVSKNIFGEYHITSTAGGDGIINSRLSSLLKQEYYNVCGEKISLTTLKYCVDILNPKYQPKGINIPANEIRALYPPYFSIGLINIYEVAKTIHSELNTKGDDNRVVPQKNYAIEKARDMSAMPERMIASLARFMLPKV